MIHGFPHSFEMIDLSKIQSETAKKKAKICKFRTALKNLNHDWCVVALAQGRDLS